MKNYSFKYRVADFDFEKDTIWYANIHAPNENQADALLAQEFPNRISVERVKSFPRNVSKDEIVHV